MKTYRKLMLALAGILLAASPIVRADTGTVSPPAPEHSKKHMAAADALGQKLHLTDDQKKKVTAILKDQKAAQKLLKRDTSVPDEVKEARHREIADQHNSQI